MVLVRLTVAMRVPMSDCGVGERGVNVLNRIDVGRAGVEPMHFASGRFYKLAPSCAQRGNLPVDLRVGSIGGSLSFMKAMNSYNENNSMHLSEVAGCSSAKLPGHIPVMSTEVGIVGYRQEYRDRQGEDIRLTTLSLKLSWLEC